jgi:uncharacterized protein
MKDFVRNIVREFVEHPDDLKIVCIDGAKTVVMELRCHEDDLGKVIGKGGKTISAVRTLANAVASRQGRRAAVEVVE